MIEKTTTGTYIIWALESPSLLAAIAIVMAAIEVYQISLKVDKVKEVVCATLTPAPRTEGIVDGPRGK